MSRKVLFVHDGPLYTNKKSEVFGIHYTEEIKQRYLQLGDSVTFCMREKKIHNSRETKFSRISDKDFEFIPFPNFKSLSTYLANKPKAKKIIETAVQNHDVLVARMPSASGTIAIKTARKYKIPYLVEMVACTYDAYRYYNWKGKLVAPYKLRKIQKVIKDCSYVIYVTKDFLQNRYTTKVKSIHCYNVKLKPISREVLNERLDRIIDGQNRNVTLTLGSIGVIDVKYKGQADVIRALHKLKQQSLIYKYKIVGQGDPSRLQNLIDKLGMSDEIEIVGSLPSEKINDFLQTIDIYIQPSKTEGLPRALIEAMSMACPAAGSKVGGIPELLNSDCLFEAGNINEIADIIKSFTGEKLLKKAKRNYKEAKLYRTETLERRRTEFYETFLKESNFEE